MATTDDQLLTLDEAAKRLRTGSATLERWQTVGFGPVFVKVGHAVRYRPSDLNAFIEQGTRRSTTAKRS